MTDEMKKFEQASTSHHDAVIRELREDPELAAEYLKATLAEEDEGEKRLGLLRIEAAKNPPLPD
jgi:DNA-binding phage protein